MSNELVPAGEDPRELAARTARLIHDFLAGRSPRTERTYKESLRQLADFAGVATPDELVPLLSRSMGAANDLVMRWKTSLLERELAPATINARLTAARSLVRRMRVIGLVPWTLEVAGVRSQPYRDTAGPSLELVRAFLATAGRSPRPACAARDVAILRCLFDLALRRYEVCGLELEHVKLDEGALWILPKGKRERIPVYLSTAAKAALVRWLEVRGADAGPVFLSLAIKHRDQRVRLTEDGLNKLVRRLGRRVGGTEAARVTPHGFRHAAVTTALNAGRDVREVQRFTRHARLETVMVYDDNRKRLSRDLAEVVSRALEQP